MTEKEKMLSGNLYDASDEELVRERRQAKDLCFQINHTLPSDLNTIQQALKKLLSSPSELPDLTPPFYCDYGYNITFGKGCYANHGLVILDCAEVKIGNHVLFGPNCGVYTAGHPLDVSLRDRGLESALPIKIGSSVWFGGNVILCPGVTIGDNVVIGAGSVVTKDIPSNVVAYGNPCRVIRKLKEEMKI